MRVSCSLVESRATICMILGAMTPEMAVEAVMKYWENEIPSVNRVTAWAPAVLARMGVPARQ